VLAAAAAMAAAASRGFVLGPGRLDAAGPGAVQAELEVLAPERAWRGLLLSSLSSASAAAVAPAPAVAANDSFNIFYLAPLASFGIGAFMIISGYLLGILIPPGEGDYDDPERRGQAQSRGIDPESLGGYKKAARAPSQAPPETPKIKQTPVGAPPGAPPGAPGAPPGAGAPRRRRAADEAQVR